MTEIEDNTLDKLYKDLFFPSKTVFEKAASKKGFSKIKVNEYLKQKTEAHVFKREKKQVNHISHPLYDYVFMADLMQLDKYKSSNKGYQYCLVVLEYQTRYLWAFPLKNKTAPEIATNLETIFEQMVPASFRRFISDGGKEFQGNVAKLLKKYNFNVLKNLYELKNPDEIRRRSTAPVDRVIQSILIRLRRIWVAEHTFEWVDNIEKIVKIYNQTFHGKTNQKPAKLWEKRKHYLPKTIDIPTYTHKFKIGEKVLIPSQATKFAKKTLLPSASDTATVLSYKNEFVETDKGEFLESELRPATFTLNKEQIQKQPSTKVKRLNQKSGIKAGHEVAHVDDQGNPTFKKRLQPTANKRIPKKVSKE